MILELLFFFQYEQKGVSETISEIHWCFTLFICLSYVVGIIATATG